MIFPFIFLSLFLSLPSSFFCFLSLLHIILSSPFYLCACISLLPTSPSPSPYSFFPISIMDLFSYMQYSNHKALSLFTLIPSFILISFFLSPFVFFSLPHCLSPSFTSLILSPLPSCSFIPFLLPFILSPLFPSPLILAPFSSLPYPRSMHLSPFSNPYSFFHHSLSPSFLPYSRSM